MSDDNGGVHHPVLKGISVVMVWVAGMSWGERASMVAFGYTCLLIFEWFWKMFWKPLFIRWGWIKGRPRGFMESTDRVPLDLGDHR